MITFSSDSDSCPPISDQDIARKLIRCFFMPDSDPSQAKPTPGRVSWASRNFSELFNIIKDDDRVIGCINMFPCSIKLMDDFCNKKITEGELLEIIKSNHPEYHAVYFCVAVIEENYRGKGLVLSASLSSLKNFLLRTNIKPVLFYWGFSNAGESLALKVAGKLGLDIRKREE